MHPAFSVIFFTVTSGFGYGLFILFVLAGLFGWLAEASVPTLAAMAITALVLITAGLMSSTLHLANPKNAWRAFSRFRTSWLSREGVFALVFYPVALAYFGLLWQQGGFTGPVQVFGILAALIAVVTLFSTGMIYACLKTIPQWNNALVPANYLLIGLMSGGLLFTALYAALIGPPPSGLLLLDLVLLAVAATTKLIYYFWIGQPTGTTINTATGFTRAAVRLLDVGHTAGTFLTEEFGYEVSSGQITTLRTVGFALTFVLPFALLAPAVFAVPQATWLLYLAPVFAYLGLVAERWLFFAEARHVVNLYHGMQRA